MFDHTRLRGPSENWGPHELLTALDTLLVSVGWARMGADPGALTYDIGDNRAGDNHNQNRAPDWGPFGYQQPGTGECVWFQVQPQWGKNGAVYNLGLRLYLWVKPTWDPAPPDGVILLASHYYTNSHSNEEAEWVIGAGDEGFYLMQVRGSYPGGFLVERTKDGSDRWLIQSFRYQNRWFYRTGYVWFAPYSPNDNNTTDAWFAGEVDGILLQRSGDEVTFVGRATRLTLGITDDNTSGEVITPDGPLQTGHWFHVPGFYPVTSNLVRQWYLPNDYVEVVEDEEVMRFRKFVGNGPFATHSWRVA